MLTNVYVITWSGSAGKDVRVADATNGSNFLLNGNRIDGLEVRATTHSKFMFRDSFKNYREKSAYLEAIETVATIQHDIDKSWASQFENFNFYVDNDPSQTTFNRYINVDSVDYVFPDPVKTNLRSYIVYYEGDKRMQLLCNLSIKQVWAKFDTGILTTTAN